METKKFKRIADVRVDHDDTQESVAHKIFNVPRSTYKRWEIGLSPFPIDKLNEFANHYNTSFDYLTNLTDSHKSIYCHKIEPTIISKRLKEERLKRNLLQKEVIQIIGIAQNSYSDYENYKIKNVPNILILYKLAKAYNISLDYLCGRTNNPKIT